MTITPFVSLPFFTKLAIMLVPFIGWVMFAEFVIDRNGWDRFLPFYRFGRVCPYEGVVLAVIAGTWIWLELRGKHE